MYVEIEYVDKVNESIRTMRLVVSDLTMIPFVAKKKTKRFSEIRGEPKILTDVDLQRDTEKGYL